MSSIINKVGETNVTKDGIKMEITAYRSATDIDVLLDGKTTIKTSYRQFINGSVPKIEHSRKKYIGKKIKTINYGVCIIIEYYSINNIIVQFEDKVKTRTTLSSINRGTIKHPNSNADGLLMKRRQSRIGFESVNKDGERAVVVRYDGCRDFTVKFDDESTLDLYDFSKFERGIFIKPTSKVGEERIMSNGLKAKIIKYISAKNMTVQFENGTIRDNVCYSSFKKGYIALEYQCKPKEGNVTIVVNGVKAKIIKYISNSNITIRLEDGTILENRKYKEFYSGKIKHPTIGNTGKGSFGSFDLSKRAFRHNQDVHYFCQCRNCGYKDILTPSEMLKHKCKGGI